jgi:hypothetical protein
MTAVSLVTGKASTRVRLTSAVIYVGESGEIDKIEGPVKHEETVLETRFDRGRLRIKARQDDGDVVEYEMMLEGRTAATLTVLGAPANVKPFHLQ